MSQIDVTSIVNKIIFKVDQSSYQRAIKMIRNVGAEWQKVQGKMSSAMSAGRKIAGTSGRGGGGSRSQFVGPMPFSPGTNTKMQQREAKKAAQEQARIARQTETATKKHNDTLRKLREIDARRQESEAKRQEQFKNKIAGQFMGPMPSRDMLIARREAIRNQRNEANRSARAQETITAGNIRRTSMFGGAGNAAMGSQVASLNAQLKSGAISLQVYRQSVAALERDFKRASAGGRDFLGTLREVRSAFIALTAANLAFTGGAAVMRTGQMFEGINAAMSMTSDSSSETASKIQFIRDEAYRLGLDLKTAAQGFTQMSVAGKEVLSSSQIQELFTGFSEYATALGMDQVRYERSITAIGQMLNKNQIMSEELKGQLAEQAPGVMNAFMLAAREAFNDDSIDIKKLFKLMEDGKLLSEDIMGLVSKYMAQAARKGGALEKMLNSNGVAMRRLQQTWTSFQNEIFMGGFGEALTRTFNILAFSLKNNEQLAKSLGGVFGGLVDGFIYFYGTIHDYSILAWHAINTEFLTPLKEAIPILNEVGAKDAAWLAGWIVAAGIFKNIAGFLGSIVAALIKIPKLLPAALPGVEAATAGAAGGAGVGAGTAAAGVGVGATMSRLLGFGPLAGAAGQGYFFHNFVQDYFVPWQKSVVDSMFGGNKLRTDLRPSLQGTVSAPSMETYPYSPMMRGMPYIPGSVNKPMEPQELKIKVIPNDTKFSEVIRLEIEANNNKVYNQLTD